MLRGFRIGECRYWWSSSLSPTGSSASRTTTTTTTRPRKKERGGVHCGWFLAWSWRWWQSLQLSFGGSTPGSLLNSSARKRLHGKKSKMKTNWRKFLHFRSVIWSDIWSLSKSDVSNPDLYPLVFIFIQAQNEESVGSSPICSSFARK